MLLLLHVIHVALDILMLHKEQLQAQFDRKALARFISYKTPTY